MPLRIVGSGPDMQRLRAMAGPTITFTGWAPRESLPGIFAGCRALVFPGEEDFGIVPVEAMASGKPVIALGRGGALETVVDIDNSQKRSPTGIFYYDQSIECLIDAVLRFERLRPAFSPERIREHSCSFRRERFEAEVANFISREQGAFRRA